MKKKYKLGVIIVNFRTPALVEQCLDTISPMLETADAGVAVVDNNSGDGSADRLEAHIARSSYADRVFLVRSPVNGGFSAGNNVGLSAIDSDFVLFLNSDAEARPGAIETLLAAAEVSPDASIFAPRILSSKGEAQVSRFRNHTMLGEFLDGAQTGPLTRLFPGAEVPIFDGDSNSRPDWVSFAAVMIRRRDIEAAGPMDENFFLYFEDCDYCRRITAAGAGIEFVPSAEFIHDEGGSTKLSERAARAARLPAYYYRARSYYFRKYYGPLGVVGANAAWLAGRAIARLRSLVGRPAPAVSEGRARDMWLGWAGSTPAQKHA